MGGNPFQDQVDDTFVGRRVRVHADGAVYEGWLQIREYNDQSALLIDAERGDGEHVGEVMVNDVDAIERCDPEATVECIHVASLAPSPYTQRSFETENFRQFVRMIRDRGSLPSFPLARPLDGGQYEIVSGHRRTEAARRAGLEAIPVRIADLSDWEATRIFLDEHVPAGKAELNESGHTYSEWYQPAQLDALVERLREDWSDERLREHQAMQWYLDNAYLGPADDEGADADDEGADDADTDAPEEHADVGDGRPETATAGDDRTDGATEASPNDGRSP